MAFTNIIKMQANKYCGNTHEIIDALMIGVCSVIGLIKHIMFRIYAGNLTRNYTCAIDDYCTIVTDKKRIIMRKHAFMGRMIFFFVVTFAFCVSTGLIMTPVVKDYLRYTRSVKNNGSMIKFEALSFPVPSECTLGNYELSTRTYLLIFVTQAMHILISSAAYIGKLK